MAAADTREAIEFSVGLRRDGEPGKQREQSLINPMYMYLKMKAKIITSLYVYEPATITHKMHIGKLDF